MMKLRKLSAILLAGTIIGVPLAQAQAATNLTWQMWVGNDAETAAWQHLADMVHEKYPDITVTLKTSAWTDYWTKLPVLAASGQLADIVSMQSLRTPNFYKIMAPLDDYVTKSKFDKSAFLPSIMNGMSADGHLYGLPYDVGPWVIFYNKDSFDAAGLAAPKDDWTMADFTKDAKALTKDGKYGLGVTPTLFPLWVIAAGGNYLDKNGNVAFTQPDVISAAKQFVGMVTTDKVAPAVPASADPGAFTTGRFDSGNVAMYVDGPWSLIGKKGDVKFKIGIAPLPAGTNGSQSVTAGSGFGIAASSPNKDDAWKAIQVLTSPAAEEYLAKQGRALPARVAQQKFWYDFAAKDVTGAKASLEYAMAHSQAYPIGNNWNTVESLMNQYLPLALSGAQPVEQTLKSIQSLATQN